MTTENISQDVVEVVATGTVEKALDAFRNNTSNVLSTFTGGTHKDKLSQLAAIQGAKKIKENLDKVIKLENFIIQPLEIADQQTGELRETARVILVDASGESFYGFGMPMVNALQDIVAMMEGMPKDWEEPVPVKVTKVTTRQGFEAFNLQTVATK